MLMLPAITVCCYTARVSIDYGPMHLLTSCCVLHITQKERERERERKRKRDRCKEGCKENKPGEMENKTEREREEREKKSAPYVRKRLCLIDNQLLKAGPVWGCLLP